jgi:hypothetical protein
MPNLYTSATDQITEYERIFNEARDRWSIDKDPRFLSIQVNCLRAIRQLKYSLNDSLDGN